MTAPSPIPDAAAPSPALPGPGHGEFAIAAFVFLRLLALIHLIAFASFWTQLEGLVGPHGILPAGRYFGAVHEQLGSSAYLQLPSLCWWFGTQTFLHVLCGAGVVLSLLVFAGVAPAFGLILLWAAYLSLNGAGQIFFNFQWDALLLETTLLAVFLAPWTALPLWRRTADPRCARLLLWWLLFRLMFLSGVVKLASGDPSWRNLTALTFHYETQPLPTSLGWCAHQLPAWWHRGTCAAMFVVELAAPFLLFAPRRLRHTGASLLAALMIGVALTGNYTFFNLLAIALCLLCFDDAWWRRALSFRPIQALASRFATRAAPAPRWQQRATLPFAVFTVAFTLAQLLPLFRATSGAGIFGRIEAFVSPFRSFNTYGLFAVMTNPRPELIFEGSNDGVVWQPYELPHKPGALDRRPTWVAPHQPRLDWQLWFAALGSLEQNQWVLAVCEHLLRGTPQVLALFSDNPFRDAPPRYVRVVRYEFHFTDAATRAATGHWWRRTPIDYYLRSASLK